LDIIPLHDRATGTITYIVVDPATDECAVIDSVLDYDPAAARTSTRSVEHVAATIAERGLRLRWLLETHVHADHLSGAAWLKARLGGAIAIGDRVSDVQRVFGEVFDLGAGFATDGRQFDHRFCDGEGFRIGGLSATALHTPGHTPACMSYLIGDAVFVGDTLFMPNAGTARCDFPGGDAGLLYRSIRRILALPADTRVFTCHDYGHEHGRAPAWQSTVAEQRAANIHIHDGIDEAAFVAMRTARDATLGMPTLILPSVQVNIRAGDLPEPDAAGRRFLKLPLNRF
jgi:glyoxylase-like metal-dependent hydrolase (beta-lactamase superfamily II)